MNSDLTNQTRGIAESLLGEIDWAAGGIVRCPGIHLHSKGTNGKRDCRVFLEGDKPPTIYCVHQNGCVAIVAEKNRALRSAIGKAKWQAERGEDPELPARPVLTRAEQLRRARQRRLDDLAARARRALPDILRSYRWPVEQIAANSPEDTTPGWRAVLGLFAPDDVVWIGDRRDSGAPRFATHFRTAAGWLRGGLPAGPLLSAACWRSGCFQRSADQIVHPPFLVVESDVLGKEDIGAVFRWCQEDGLALRAVIDTAGKGLHGWFERPTHARCLEERVAVLTAMGCDPGPMRAASMSRLPDAQRDGRRQRLLWIKASGGGVEGWRLFHTLHARARSSPFNFSIIDKTASTPPPK